MTTLGFIHAQDRIWQMNLMKKTIYGELSELFGTRTIQIDQKFRAYQFKKIAKLTYDKLQPATKDILTAYSNGVNAYIELINKTNATNQLEVTLTHTQIEKWNPEDSIGILKLLSFDLSGKALSEIKALNFLQLLTTQQMDDILPNLSKMNISPLLRNLNPTNNKNNTSKPTIDASNVWALTPDLTATKGTLGASDPHLKLSAPIIWMLVQFNFENQIISGGSIPGIPAIFIGRNDNIAWGLTNVGADDQDLLLLRVLPNNNYQSPLGPEKFYIIKEEIKIKNKKSITKNYRYTKAGPIIDPNDYGIEYELPKGYALVLNWTAFDPSDRTIENILNVMSSKTRSNALDQFKQSISPYNNVMIMDKTGVALQTSGRPPLRKLDNDTFGLLPATFEKLNNHWFGYTPFSKNPSITNPKNGYVVNTNNKITDQKYPFNFTFIWRDTNRYLRANELLASKNVNTSEDMKHYQLDTQSKQALKLMPILLKHLSKENQTKYNSIIKSLQNWDYKMNTNSFEALIYHQWLYVLEQSLFEPLLGDHWDRIFDVNPNITEIILNNSTKQKNWCNSNDCTNQINKAFISAIEKLNKLHGKNFNNWHWGNVHIAKLENIYLGRIPILSWLANLQTPIDGDDNTLLASKITRHHDHPFDSDQASGLRAIFDLSSEEMPIIIATGQSNNPLSSHYQDQFKLWKKKEYIVLHQDKKRIIEDAKHFPLFKPKVQ